MNNIKFIFIVFFIMFSLLFARENPFQPVVNPIKQQIVKREFFKQKKIYLPKEARLLKKIVFVYQTVSGDIKKQSIDIDKSVDFHYPMIITHKYITFKTRYANFPGLFRLVVKKDKIFIITSDVKVRSFFLVKPFRVVIDFIKDADFLTISKNINTYLKKVVVGNHEGYYRVVMYFDTNYNYNIKQTKKGYEIDLQ